MRIQSSLVVLVTLLFVSVPLKAGDQPGYLPSPYPSAHGHPSLASREVSERAPASASGLSAASDLRNPVDGRVFTTEVEPSVTVEFSRSPLQLQRRGLKYHGAGDDWSVGLKYHRLKVAPDLELLIDERTERPNVLKMEWSVRFQ